jgi:hypothetical protein
VTMRKSATVSSPTEGLYRVHLATGPQDFNDVDQALCTVEEYLKAEALADAQASGAQDITLRAERDIRQANIENNVVFVEATILVEASGRARIAS